MAKSRGEWKGAALKSLTHDNIPPVTQAMESRGFAARIGGSAAIASRATIFRQLRGLEKMKTSSLIFTLMIFRNFFAHRNAVCKT